MVPTHWKPECPLFLCSVDTGRAQDSRVKRLTCKRHKDPFAPTGSRQTQQDSGEGVFVKILKGY